MNNNIREKIQNGKTHLGIELGSTRIKACLVDDTLTTVADGCFDWENKFENGYWTYDLDLVHTGVQACFADLAKSVSDKYGVTIQTVGSMGVSAMMHGYLAFDKDGKLLTPFRTWRNTTTLEASEKLSDLFGVNIPQRWSISHLYQAMLNGEEHVSNIAYITTLAGYVHYLLTGKRELGVGDASGMFPIADGDYDKIMLEKFDGLCASYGWSIYGILPKVVLAGKTQTCLSAEGARFLDPTGVLQAGIPVCAPEGDAGTGMVATNAVRKKTGNVSAGTSIFAMIVLEKPLENAYPEIDVVTTPDASPVAMVHCNNCAAELDAFVKLFGEFATLIGADVDKSKLYSTLYNNVALADADCGGVVAYNYLSGEHVTGVESGRPMYFRTPDSKMTLANFMKAQLCSAVSTLAIGMKILFEKEGIAVNSINAHGGLFKVKGVAQQILADALNTSVSVMENASEGGAYGMALLAAYAVSGESDLAEWLDRRAFASNPRSMLCADAEGVRGFKRYLEKYEAGLCAQKSLKEV